MAMYRALVDQHVTRIEQSGPEIARSSEAHGNGSRLLARTVDGALTYLPDCSTPDLREMPAVISTELPSRFGLT